MVENVRKDLQIFFNIAVQAVHGKHLWGAHTILANWTPPVLQAGGRLRLIAVGKAAAALVEGFLTRHSAALTDGILILPEGKNLIYQKIQVVYGGHPLPDIHGFQAAQTLLEFIGHPQETDFYLIFLSGGASALLALPILGVSIEDKSALTRQLLHSGANINQINTVRKHLSGLKGGQLARRLKPSRWQTFAISDVQGDIPEVIGSGLTVADSSTFLEALQCLQELNLLEQVPPTIRNHLTLGVQGDIPETPKGIELGDPSKYFTVVASADDALAAVVLAAQAAGYVVQSLGRTLYGPICVHATQLAATIKLLLQARRPDDAPLLLLAAGEPTVQVTGNGLGGRNQELALHLAQRIAGFVGVTVLVAGTDGIDGPTHAAGAYVDGQSWARAQAAGVDPADGLAHNDSHRVLDASSDLFITGATGTNVADLVMAVVH